MPDENNQNTDISKHNEISKISWKKALLNYAAALGLGAASASIFPPLELSPLVWMMLIPLYYLIASKRPLQAMRLGFTWGLGIYFCSFFWLREIEWMVPIFMAPVLACFPAIWACTVPLLRRNIMIPNEIRLKGFEAENAFKEHRPLAELLLVVSIAASWAVLEWLRSWIFTGLPWNYLAASQWQNIALIQMAEYTGVYGISFLIVMVNISAAIGISSMSRSFREHKYHRPLPFLVSMALLLVSISLCSRYLYKKQNPENSVNFTAGILQGDISQRRFANESEAREAIDIYSQMTEDMLKPKEEKESAEEIINVTINGTAAFADKGDMPVRMNPDIVIWPETAVPYPLFAAGPVSQTYREKLLGAARKYKQKFLVGTIDFGDQKSSSGDFALYNSAMLINENGRVEAKFRKIHLVPFGEFVPLGNRFPILNRIVGMGRNLSEGTNYNPIKINDDVFAGINICFEDIFSNIAREEARLGANLLLVITNDAWYPKSSEPTQHLAQSVFRAVETRLPLIRNGNNSCSVLISPAGIIQDTVFKERDENGKTILHYDKRGRASAKFKTLVQKNPELTFYTRYGDVFILVCIFILAASALLGFMKWRARKNNLFQPKA